MSSVGAVRPTPATAPPAPSFDVQRIRRDFPILSQKIHGMPLVYLDNAATTQKPISVIEAERDLYERFYANIHRGVHWLSVESTEAYERVRETVRGLLHAAEAREIVFTRGTTEAINLVAATYGRTHVGAGDEVLITALEHHSNIVPWQMLCEEKGAKLKVVPIDLRGELILEELERLLSDRTKIVAVSHVSNALGTVNPIGEIVRLAHAKGIPVLVDGTGSESRPLLLIVEVGVDEAADGIAPGEHSSHEGLVHDRHLRRTAAVAFVEAASAHDRHLHLCEIIRSDDAAPDFLRRILGTDGNHGNGAAHRQIGGAGHVDRQAFRFFLAENGPVAPLLR